MFPWAIVNILETKEKKSLTKEIKDTKYNQIKILKLKNISKAKNTVDGLKSRIKGMKESVNIKVEQY